MTNLRLANTTRQIKYITRSEYKSLTPTIDKPRDKVLAMILWSTGVTVTEALEITYKSWVKTKRGAFLRVKNRMPKGVMPSGGIELQHQIRGLKLSLEKDSSSKVIQRKLKSAERELQKVQKIKHQSVRLIPVSKRFLDKIDRFCHNHGVYDNEPILPISRKTAFVSIKKMCGKIDMEPDRSNPMAFRHGFAVNAVLSAVPPRQLQEWMGFTSLSYTSIYYQVLVKDPHDYLNTMKV